MCLKNERRTLVYHIKISIMTIVYFSNTGITQQVVEFITANVEAKIIRVESIVPYPIELDAAKAIVVQQNQENVFPAYHKVETDLKDNVILLGYPVWDKRLPPVLRSYLKDCDLSGKTIIPFNTHLGFGTGNSIDDINTLAPKAIVQEPLSIANSDMATAADVVKEWVSEVLLAMDYKL